MTRDLTLLVIVTVVLLAWAVPVLAQCPEDPNDHGICDTTYVEVYECDSLFAGEAKQVRIPIRVTNDIPNPVIDSIACFVIPLCFTTSNSSAQCFLDPSLHRTGMGAPFFDCYPWDNPERDPLPPSARHGRSTRTQLDDGPVLTVSRP